MATSAHTFLVSHVLTAPDFRHFHTKNRREYSRLCKKSLSLYDKNYLRVYPGRVPLPLLLTVSQDDVHTHDIQ
jgi:hypothetical protein